VKRVAAFDRLPRDRSLAAADAVEAPHVRGCRRRWSRSVATTTRVEIREPDHGRPSRRFRRAGAGRRSHRPSYSIRC